MKLPIKLILFVFMLFLFYCSNKRFDTVEVRYSIGGTISGLTATLVIENNNANNVESLNIVQNGSYKFKEKFSKGYNYNVSVKLQPSGQNCAVSNSSGNISNNVLNINFNCSSTSTADTSPPVFAGLNLAATATSSQINLSWLSATDNTSASSSIVYEIYMALSTGSQNFTGVSFTSTAGATSYTVTALSSNTAYFFVVRARDEAGNKELNTTEKTATTAPFTYGGFNWYKSSAKGSNCNTTCSLIGKLCQQAGLNAYSTDATCTIARYFLPGKTCSLCTPNTSTNVYCFAPGYVDNFPTLAYYYNLSGSYSCATNSDNRSRPICPCN